MAIIKLKVLCFRNFINLADTQASAFRDGARVLLIFVHQRALDVRNLLSIFVVEMQQDSPTQLPVKGSIMQWRQHRWLQMLLLKQ